MNIKLALINFVNKLLKVDTEIQGDEDYGTRILIRNEDGTYTEVISNDEDD